MFFTQDILTQGLNSVSQQVKGAHNQLESMTRQALATTDTLIELNKATTNETIEQCFRTNTALLNRSIAQTEEFASNLMQFSSLNIFSMAQATNQADVVGTTQDSQTQTS
jgi:hypothetical protein